MTQDEYRAERDRLDAQLRQISEEMDRARQDGNTPRLNKLERKLHGLSRARTNLRRKQRGWPPNN
jgi:hypothetical protein